MKKVVHEITNAVLNFFLLTGIAAILLMLTGIIRPITGSGRSMQPTFNAGDDFHIGLSTEVTNLHAGDIVKFSKPDGSEVIKRIIAFGGDTVYTKDGCTFYVNGGSEPYSFTDACSAYITEQYGEKTWILGEDEVFVAGDNRTNSLDSRDYGPVKKDKIEYKLIYNF